MSRAGVVVIAFAVLFAGCGDEYEKGAGVYTAPAQRTITVPPAPPREPAVTVTMPSAPAEPSEGTERARLTAAQRRASRAALGSAQRFLASYLPYSYGRRSARTIRRATAQLRRELARSEPRVTATMRRARPRVRDLVVSGFARGRVVLLATVADGRQTYVVTLTAEPRRGRWVIGKVF